MSSSRDCRFCGRQGRVDGGRYRKGNGDKVYVRYRVCSTCRIRWATKEVEYIPQSALKPDG